MPTWEEEEEDDSEVVLGKEEAERVDGKAFLRNVYLDSFL